jgi:hypothetical protein
MTFEMRIFIKERRNKVSRKGAKGKELAETELEMKLVLSAIRCNFSKKVLCQIAFVKGVKFENVHLKSKIKINEAINLISYFGSSINDNYTVAFFY